jgi:hypothetical protein
METEHRPTLIEFPEGRAIVLDRVEGWIFDGANYLIYTTAHRFYLGENEFKVFYKEYKKWMEN